MILKLNQKVQICQPEGYTAHEAVGFSLSKTGIFPISILRTMNNENKKI